MPHIDVVRMKKDQADIIHRRVVNQEPTYVSVKQMIENFTIMASFLY